MVYKAKKKPAARGSKKAAPALTGPARAQYVMPNTNVFEAALDRIRWIFNEFDGHVSVSNSGGKDSTVVLELALIVAKERGELPLKVVWLDQECEFEATVEYQRNLFYNRRDEIDFHWYQVPFQLVNATSAEEYFSNVWGEGEEWVRPKEPESIHENDLVHHVTGEPVTRFKEVLMQINRRTGGAILTGMRAEEAPGRRLFLTSKPAYKWATWTSEGTAERDADGKKVLDEDGNPKVEYYMFHPIWDWSYRDVWHAIYENDWTYNAMYDIQFRYGVGVRQMRVSNYHHVEALGSLKYLQEAEPRTWEAATRRLKGINTFGHLGGASDMIDGKLPYMFKDWDEYLHHLIDNLIHEESDKEEFRKMQRRMLKALPDLDPNAINEVMVGAVLRNDKWGVSVEGFMLQQRSKAKFAKLQEAAFAGEDDEDDDNEAA